MFGANRAYGKAALHAAVRHIEQHASAETREAAKISFVSVLDGAMKGAYFDLAGFAKPLRAARFTQDEAGLALIDYVVTSAKRLAETTLDDRRERLLAVVTQLEPVIDATHCSIAARFTPDNGEAAPLTQEEEREIRLYNELEIKSMSNDEKVDSILLNDAWMLGDFAKVRAVLRAVRERAQLRCDLAQA